MSAKSLLRSLALVFFGLALTLSASGQTAPPASVTLTPGTVESFIASFPVVRAKANELSAQYQVPEGGSAAATWQAWAGIEAARNELDATVGAYGFPDFTAWTQTMSAVARAYAFSREGASLDGKMAEALAKIRDHPNIPAAQKEMMIQQLQHSAGAIAGMRPSQENIDAVKAYSEQLKAVFDDNG